MDGKLFTPKAYLHRVDPADFGCEGRQEGQSALGAVWCERPDGRYFWRMEEQELLCAGFTDDLWIGIYDGKIVLIPDHRNGRQDAVPGAALHAVLYETGIIMQ